MAKTPHCQLTARDREILTSLLRDPKTPDQLLRESVVFRHPFRTRCRLQVRLKQLADAGYVNRWRYFDGGDGAAPFYYKLSPEGFRIAAGHDVRPPSKRYFRPISPSLQKHHRAVADCNVHVLVAASRDGVNVARFEPHGSCTLPIGNEKVQPDSAWQLLSASGLEHNFFFEIDCSTESVTSSSGRANTLGQKILRYEALHYDFRSPFRVVFFFTQSRERLEHCLSHAGQLVRNRHRIIFYGIRLEDFLSSDAPLCASIFEDQNGRPASLIKAGNKSMSVLAGDRKQVYSRDLRW